MRTLFLALTLPLAIVTLLDSQPFKSSTGDVAVFRKALRYFLSPVRESEKPGTVVLLVETTVRQCDDKQRQRVRVGCLPASAEYAARYASVWERSRRPQPVPDLGIDGVTRVPVAAVAKAQGSTRVWEEFMTARLGAQIIGMSMPALSGDRAMLYVEQYRDKGGFGAILHLRLKDGNWVFSDIEVMWLLD